MALRRHKEGRDSRNVGELGSPGLSARDEADIVSYLKAFTDNYPKWGNSSGRLDLNVPEGTPSPYRGYPDHSIWALPRQPQ